MGKNFGYLNFAATFLCDSKSNTSNLKSHLFKILEQKNANKRSYGIDLHYKAVPRQIDSLRVNTTRKGESENNPNLLGDGHPHSLHALSNSTSAASTTEKRRSNQIFDQILFYKLAKFSHRKISIRPISASNSTLRGHHFWHIAPIIRATSVS